MGDHVWAHCPTINASMIISAFIVKMQKVLILLLVLREHLTAFLKFASLCNYIYRTKKSTSATDRSETDWSSLLQSSSCYIVAWHSIGAALFVCTVIWWETCFLSLCPLWLDPGHVGGWEMKRRRRSGRIRSLSSGFKARFTHSLWTVCMKRLWMCWFV